MSSRSWYNSGSDIKWSWEGALGFRSPCPQPPSLDADRQVMRSSLERETLLPLEGSPRPPCSTGWGGRGASPDCPRELGSCASAWPALGLGAGWTGHSRSALGSGSAFAFAGSGASCRSPRRPRRRRIWTYRSYGGGKERGRWWEESPGAAREASPALVGSLDSWGHGLFVGTGPEGFRKS